MILPLVVVAFLVFARIAALLTTMPLVSGVGVPVWSRLALARRANASAMRLGGSIIAASAQKGTQRHPNAPVQAAAVVAGGSHLERVPPPKHAAAFRGRSRRASMQ